MAQTQPVKKNRYCWVIFICCCFAGLCGVGLISNTYGVFLPSIVKDLGFGTAQTSAIMTIQSWTTVAFYFVGAKAMVKFNARWVTSIAGVIIAAALFGYSQATQIWQFYIIAFVLGAVGAFAALNVVPLLINNWFIKHRNLVIGIAYMMTGIGGAIYNPLFASVSVQQGWRTGYMVAAAIAMIYPILSVIFVRMTPAEKGLQPLGFAESKEMEAIKDQVEIKEFPGVPAKYAFKTAPLYLILIFIIFNGFCTGFNQHWVNTGVSYGFDLVTASTLTTAAMLSAAVFKVVGGWMNDRIGVRNTSLVFSALGIISMVIMITVNGRSFSAMLVACILFGALVALTTMQPPMAVRELFGMRNYSTLYPIAFMGMSFGTGVTYTLHGMFIEMAGSYMGSFIFNLISAVISMIAIFLAFTIGKKVKAKYWREVGEAL